MVVGTATAIGFALTSQRTRAPAVSLSPMRLAPAVAPIEPSRQPVWLPSVNIPTLPSPPSLRAFAIKYLGGGAALALIAIIIVSAFPALGTFASDLSGPTPVSQSESAATPPDPASLVVPDDAMAVALAKAWSQGQTIGYDPDVAARREVFFGEIRRYEWSVLAAMRSIAEQRDSDEAQGVPVANPVSAPRAQPYTLRSPSGYAVGTVLRARITIYGCTGPGGGFCNHMAGGGYPFHGAAACSSDLPFGTRLTIAGDPTGAVYECLDRGSLTPTWVDVYFADTSDGMAWQSQLGGTVANITIVN